MDALSPASATTATPETAERGLVNTLPGLAPIPMDVCLLILGHARQSGGRIVQVCRAWNVAYQKIDEGNYNYLRDLVLRNLPPLVENNIFFEEGCEFKSVNGRVVTKPLMSLQERLVANVPLMRFQLPAVELPQLQLAHLIETEELSLPQRVWNAVAAIIWGAPDEEADPAVVPDAPANPPVELLTEAPAEPAAPATPEREVALFTVSNSTTVRIDGKIPPIYRVTYDQATLYSGAITQTHQRAIAEAMRVRSREWAETHPQEMKEAEAEMDRIRSLLRGSTDRRRREADILKLTVDRMLRSNVWPPASRDPRPVLSFEPQFEYYTEIDFKTGAQSQVCRMKRF